MENKNQDQLIQDLINDLSIRHSFYGPNYKEEKNISKYDLHEMTAVALEEGFIIEDDHGMYSLTLKGYRFEGDRYLQEAKKEREQKDLQRIKDEQRERKEEEKLDTDLTLARWQKKTFWWVFSLGGIGGICGIISLSLQLTAAPVIEKKYIPIDSKGQIHELPEQKGI